MKVFKNFNKKSILIKILLPLLVAVFIQAILLFGTFYFGGVFKTLNKNESDMLNEITKNRLTGLQNDMVNRWGNLDAYASIINTGTENVLKEHTTASLADLDNVFYDTHYDGSYTLADLILREQCDELIYFMQRSMVNGAFIVLNDDISGEKSGLFIKTNRIDGSSISDLMLKIAPPLSRDYFDQKQITKSNLDSRFIINEESNFFFSPFTLAEDEIAKSTVAGNLRNYGYWSRPFYINGKGDKSITYTVPLIFQNQVYGVVGIELTTAYLRSRLPYDEIAPDNGGSYILAIDKGQTLQFETLTATGPLFTKAYGDSTEITAAADTGYEDNYSFYTSSGKEEYCGSIQHLKIYNAFSPFLEDDWVLIALTKKSTLFSFSNHFLTLFMIIVSITVFIGIACSLLASIAVSAPVAKLTDKIRNNEIEKLGNLGRCNIYEIDELVKEIEQLSARVNEFERLEKIKIEFERDHDVMTKLKNRRAFKTQMKKFTDNPAAIKIAALLMLDLDGLKFVNDTYGHEYGDAYINAIAKSLIAFDNDKILAARLGGDEFVLFLHGFETKDEIYAEIENFKNDIKVRTIKLPDNDKYGIRFSGGIAWYPNDAVDFNILLKNADEAMYGIKHTGKGEIIEYSKYLEDETLHKSFPINNMKKI